MAERMQIYVCATCGNMVEVLRAGGGTLSCCNAAMTLLAENTVDASKEKHVPVITAIPGGYKVAVGGVAHPMEEKHFIEWIELVADGVSYRQYLAPGDVPEATFAISATEVAAREHCNLHGLWKGALTA